MSQEFMDREKGLGELTEPILAERGELITPPPGDVAYPGTRPSIGIPEAPRYIPPPPGSLIPPPAVVVQPELGSSEHRLNSFFIDTVGSFVLGANPNRRYLLIQNRSAAAAIYVTYQGGPSGGGLKIEAGGNYEPWRVPTNDIYIVADAAATPVVLIEG